MFPYSRLYRPSVFQRRAILNRAKREHCRTVFLSTVALPLPRTNRCFDTRVKLTRDTHAWKCAEMKVHSYPPTGRRKYNKSCSRLRRSSILSISRTLKPPRSLDAGYDGGITFRLKRFLNDGAPQLENRRKLVTFGRDPRCVPTPWYFSSGSSSFIFLQNSFQERS